MLIELIQDQAHAIHEAVHVRRLAVRVCRAAVTGECGLEGFEVVHPLEREVVRGDIGFIEDENEGQFGFVEDAGEGLGGGKEGRDTTTRRDGGGWVRGRRQRERVKESAEGSTHLHA